MKSKSSLLKRRNAHRKSINNGDASIASTKEDPMSASTGSTQSTGPSTPTATNTAQFPRSPSKFWSLFDRVKDGMMSPKSCLPCSASESPQSPGVASTTSSTVGNRLSLLDSMLDDMLEWIITYAPSTSDPQANSRSEPTEVFPKSSLDSTSVTSRVGEISGMIDDMLDDIRLHGFCKKLNDHDGAYLSRRAGHLQPTGVTARRPAFSFKQSGDSKALWTVDETDEDFELEGDSESVVKPLFFGVSCSETQSQSHFATTGDVRPLRLHKPRRGEFRVEQKVSTLR